MTTLAGTPENAKQKLGLAFWMDDVLQQCRLAEGNFDPDPVHDLRVALRRCRSIADGFIAIDPDPEWEKMKKSGRRLFRSLGELRDVQIMQGLTHHFGSDDEITSTKLMAHLLPREAELKLHAAQALREFDQKAWKRWGRYLPQRARRVRLGSMVFKHLALERWMQAYELHRRAIRNRSQVSLHNLRIGIKRFRYLVENFLPQQHLAWKNDLKKLQDLLGEIHDFDVLWSTCLRLHVFADAGVQLRWKDKIQEKRERRIAHYREVMTGPESRWQVWRADLPQGKQIESASWVRLNLWASVLDPDIRHSRHVMRLALELYDGLLANEMVHPLPAQNLRKILHAAALLHDVGRFRDYSNHHKESYRLISRLATPLGWSHQEFALVAPISRYHRGTLPQVKQKAFRGIPPEQRKNVLLLAGVLRFANACDAGRNRRIERIRVSPGNGFLTIAAQGYAPRNQFAENIAGARHLLETVLRRPIIVSRLQSNSKSKPGVRKPS